ncbi:Uncharacterised protein [Buttiauxella agrestis]|uniref:N-acetyltransferase domain-containing protein n=1 Tax=Buttiauxella agrestis TaxID=82977 RepID=A0A381KNS7_9ENTR|nr:GNAT family N-acetyltransferase [Buttiauxella agrestis]SUY92959.1 Uncharacterised protein [Buttiauxella agrestis]
MMRFFEKNPRNNNPLIIRLYEEREQPPEDDRHAMNFSLITENNVELASGRCSAQSEEGESDFLYISAIYVNGNTNNPTIKKPNIHSGLGQLLVFSAINFGRENNLRTAMLTPLEGSEGFYLKMGFRPRVIGNPNRMNTTCSSFGANNGKLNSRWTNHFAESSFLHDSFRGPCWVGNISLIYPVLKDYILESWTIIE